MSKFLIEVPHDPDTMACTKVIQVFAASGSHFLTHADWGCLDGDHRAWMIANVDSKDDARAIVPPAFRARAHIVELAQFSIDQIDMLMEHHGRAPKPPPART
jgi:hypothetical protein